MNFWGRWSQFKISPEKGTCIDCNMCNQYCQMGIDIKSRALQTDWFITVYEDHQVIRTGPFRFIRHPAYGGALILFVSTLLFLHAWVGALLSLIFQLFAYVRRIRYEEAFMIDRLGDQYVEYTRSVNALVPKVW
jgi:protein-S-isoprenylcysteine O-methyltransferase Ste14